jgi:hypothetical protein
MKQLLALIFVFGSFICCGQVKVLPDSCSVWKYQVHDSGGGFLFAESVTFNPELDTVIGGNVYSQLSYDLAATSQYLAAVRESSEVSYLVVKDSVTEYVLMDFSKNIGDTIFNFIVGDDLSSNSYWIMDGVLTNISTITSNTGASLAKHEIEVYRYRNLETFPHNWYNVTAGSAITYWSERCLSCDLQGCISLLSNNPFLSLSGGSSYAGYCTTDDSIVNSTHVEYCQSCKLVTGIKANNHNLNINVYPNPAVDFLFLDIPSNSELQIINSFGQIVIRQKCTESSVKINISKLTQGIYFVNVNSNHLSRTKPFVKVN